MINKNSLKSYLGRRGNIHLFDNSVLVNVYLKSFQTGNLIVGTQKQSKSTFIPIQQIKSVDTVMEYPQ